MKTTKTFRRISLATGYRLPTTGFTLVELMVVVAIIILVSATALPTLVGLFTSGQDQQAFNLLSAQLSAARALAITKGTYAGVHVQMADNPDFYISYPALPKCYTAIVIYDSTNQTFDLADGYQPQAMPGTMAFGQISGTYVITSGTHEGEYDEDHLDDPSPSDQDDAGEWDETFYGFTMFTIIFNPQGEVVTNVDGHEIVFANPLSTPPSQLFAEQDEDEGDFDDTELWRAPNVALGTNYYGVQAVTLFDNKVVRSMDAAGRKAYLDEFGQFLALNLYTGKFFARE